MKQRPVVKTKRAEVAPAPAPAAVAGPMRSIRCRFAVRLSDTELLLPSAMSDASEGLASRFFDVFLAISQDMPDPKEPGVLAFDIEATYLDAPPGVIMPENEEGPLIHLLRENLPAILGEESPESRTVIDRGQNEQWRVKAAAKLLRDSDEKVINIFLNNIDDSLARMPEDAPRSERLDAAIATVPKDAPYEELAREAARESHAFRQQLAERLAPALNARMREMPHETLEQKQALAEWVNEQLEPLGLAIRDPKTGLPGKLKGLPGNWPGVGRFAFEVYSDGKRKYPTNTDKLPELTLTDATPPKEPEQLWQEAVGPRDSRRGRVRT
jgi:hypothetical protein